MAFAMTLRPAPVRLENPTGKGRVLLLCEHASCYVPEEYAGLGLGNTDLQRHIAWDPGALALAMGLSAALDAPLAAATHSRLLIDLNRDPDALDSIVEQSEDTLIPGNQRLSEEERAHRRHWLYEPYHAAVSDFLQQRLRNGSVSAVLAIHSFNPSYRGLDRPWQVGVIGDLDRRLSAALLNGLRADQALCVGDDQPYGPNDGVYHSVHRHGQSLGLACAMLEVRNDLLLSTQGVLDWVQRLLPVIQSALQAGPINSGKLIDQGEDAPQSAIGRSKNAPRG